MRKFGGDYRNNTGNRGNHRGSQKGNQRRGVNEKNYRPSLKNQSRSNYKKMKTVRKRNIKTRITKNRKKILDENRKSLSGNKSVYPNIKYIKLTRKQIDQKVKKIDQMFKSLKKSNGVIIIGKIMNYLDKIREDLNYKDFLHLYIVYIPKLLDCAIQKNWILIGKSLGLLRVFSCHVDTMSDKIKNHLSVFLTLIKKALQVKPIQFDVIMDCLVILYNLQCSDSFITESLCKQKFFDILYKMYLGFSKSYKRGNVPSVEIITVFQRISFNYALIFPKLSEKYFKETCNMLLFLYKNMVEENYSVSLEILEKFVDKYPYYFEKTFGSFEGLSERLKLCFANNDKRKDAINLLVTIVVKNFKDNVKIIKRIFNEELLDQIITSLKNNLFWSSTIQLYHLIFVFSNFATYPPTSNYLYFYKESIIVKLILNKYKSLNLKIRGEICYMLCNMIGCLSPTHFAIFIKNKGQIFAFILYENLKENKNVEVVKKIMKFLCNKFENSEHPTFGKIFLDAKFGSVLYSLTSDTSRGDDVRKLAGFLLQKYYKNNQNSSNNGSNGNNWNDGNNRNYENNSNDWNKNPVSLFQKKPKKFENFDNSYNLFENPINKNNSNSMDVEHDEQDVKNIPIPISFGNFGNFQNTNIFSNDAEDENIEKQNVNWDNNGIWKNPQNNSKKWNNGSDWDSHNVWGNLKKW